MHVIILAEEAKLNSEPTRLVVDSLMELYNKAIVYYSALSDEKHLEYLQKLQRLFSDERVQKIMTGGAGAASKEESKTNKNESQQQQPN